MRLRVTTGSPQNSLIHVIARQNTSCSPAFQLLYEPVTVLSRSQLQSKGTFIYSDVQILYCQRCQQYDQNSNRCKVHTVPGLYLRLPGSITYPEYKYATQSFRSKRRGGIYDQVVGQKSISEFGNETTIYGISTQSSPVLARYFRTSRII